MNPESRKTLLAVAAIAVVLLLGSILNAYYQELLPGKADAVGEQIRCCKQPLPSCCTKGAQADSCRDECASLCSKHKSKSGTCCPSAEKLPCCQFKAQTPAARPCEK